MAKASKTQLQLDSPVSTIKGIGPKKAAALVAAGFETVFDLLRNYPREYQDRRIPKAIKNLTLGDYSLVKAQLKTIKAAYARRGLTIISAEFYDNESTLSIKWFNKTYLTQQLKPNFYYWLFGKVVETHGKLTLYNPEIEPANDLKAANSKHLTAIYPTNTHMSKANISPLGFRKLIQGILDQPSLLAGIPLALRENSYRKIFDSYLLLHRPSSFAALKEAQHTIAFFDQLLFQMGVLKRRENLTGKLSLPNQSKTMPYASPYPLPFELTGGQKKALGEIIFDLDAKDSPPMNRLVQGDVGSGKTLVAFLAILEYILRISPGAQAVFMAPTEILANQHLIAFKKFFPQFADMAGIVTGSLKTKERRLAQDLLATGSMRVVFGTHALFQEQIQFKELGLCVIDEQQRFGVNHRRLLFNKGENPHQLLLSATPIPRTLSLTIFGDMDTSIIDELPPGRQEITTSIAASFNNAVGAIEKTLTNGNQVYIICPLIEMSEERNWVSVEEAADTVSDLFPLHNVACLTGAQSWDEKDETMFAFKNKEIDIVVATTVVEVGVDNPNATLIIIENADCFGLSQLHQLRGRVGRGSDKSSCILISRAKEQSERLSALVETNDGFKLSLSDLKLRGPGDLVGTRQSGLSHPCFAHDVPNKLIENARIRAFEILTKENLEVRDWFVAQMVKSFGGSYKTFMEGG
jgi:ATP-dependent DNA helicase RecG